MDAELELTPEEIKKFEEFNQPGGTRPIRPVFVKDEQIKKLQQEKEMLQKKISELQAEKAEKAKKEQVMELSNETKCLLFNIMNEKHIVGGNIRFQVFLPEDYHEKLKILSLLNKKNNFTKRKLFCFILDDFFKNHEKEIEELRNFNGNIEKKE